MDLGVTHYAKSGCRMRNPLIGFKGVGVVLEEDVDVGTRCIAATVELQMNGDGTVEWQWRARNREESARATLVRVAEQPENAALDGEP